MTSNLKKLAWSEKFNFDGPRRRIRGIEACHARKFLRKSAKIEEMIHTIIPIWVLKIAEKAKEYLQI